MASDEFLTWCDDLHQVKGNISQLQATLNHVLAKAPTVSQYKQLVATYEESGSADALTGPQLVERLRTSLQSPQIKVAVRLKYLYDKGFLPFLLALTRINFKSAKADRFVGYLLDYQPPTKDIKSIEPEHENVKGHALNEEELHYPPSLPPIADQLLLRLVLTDKSLRQPSDYLELQTKGGHHDFNNNHNRKLAIRGARLLDLALVDILDEKYPKAHEDDIEYLKHRFTTNHMLARLAYCYNLTESLMHNVSNELLTSEKLIIFKNVFLAYIGAMSKSNYSFSEIKTWIQKLYEPLISRMHDEDSREHKLKDMYWIASSEFYFLISRVNGFLKEPRKKIAYEFEFHGTDPITCQLKVGPLNLGVSVSDSHADAKKKAIFATFEDKDLRSKFLDYLMEQYSAPDKSTKEQHTSPLKEQLQIQHQQRVPSWENVQPNTAESEDEAYSPELNGEDYYEPAGAPPVTTTVDQPNTTSRPVAAAPKPAATATQAPLTAVPSYQTRMPLPYGALPAIPTMKKRGLQRR